MQVEQLVVKVAEQDLAGLPASFSIPISADWRFRAFKSQMRADETDSVPDRWTEQASADLIALLSIRGVGRQPCWRPWSGWPRSGTRWAVRWSIA
jgi:hypothetical protein